MRLIWDPKPVAKMRLAGGQWQPFYPEFRILAPAISTPSVEYAYP